MTSQRRPFAPAAAASLLLLLSLLQPVLPLSLPHSIRHVRPAEAATSRPIVGRREALGSAFAVAVTALVTSASTSAALAAPRLEGYDPLSAATRPSAGRSYFPPLTPPLNDRATYLYSLGRDAWALEQLLVFANVSATVRTTVIRMNDGGLWVNGPQWPTGEFCALLDELGPVKHVVLSCNALEHKAPMGAFVKRYPDASVWVTPGQYGPFGACGMDDGRGCKMGYRVDGVLPVGKLLSSGTGSNPLWADEFDARTLYVSLPGNAGPVSESAFYHKPTKTLVTTDAVVFVPDSAPPIFGSYFDESLTSDRDFWPKSVLQAVFLPFRQRDGVSDDERWPGYASVRGRLLRAPILRAFADARAPDAVREWVDDVSAMGEFDRVVTAHFASPIAATPSDFRRAFEYLDPAGEGEEVPPIACRDWALLDSLNSAIDDNKLGAPVVYDFKRGCRQ